ncbi:hypothetical protein JXA88_16285 [Candidatus Fermentibacteria bacterium]|nr:hypothetical protein [Candidatus Fermentibacteria bacterium]
MSHTPHDLDPSHSPDLLDAVRTQCAAVAERAQWVAIRHERLVSCARDLASRPDLHPSIDPATHYLGHGDDTVAFFVTLDTINFGSGYFPLLRKRPGMSGYFTVASSLTDRFATHGPWSAKELAGLDAEVCAEVFGQRNAPPAVAELMALFARALRDLGALLASRYDGEFTALVAAADRSANRLVHVLAQMPLFRDVSVYGTRQVPFFKRAQLMAADLALALDGQGYGLFTDLDRLTIFADNLVPHVLWVDGVLRYDESLLKRINAGELIPAGSAEEVEIRACAVHAVELLVEESARLGRHASAHVLDYLLWTRGQGPAYKAIPRHRTRTTAY